MLRDLVEKNRSYRGYDESYKFTKEELMELVDLTRFVPSGMNAQVLKYKLAWEKEEVDLIQSTTKWAAALPQLTIPHDGKHPTAFIVMCQDTNLAANLQAHGKDIGIAAQTILLGAVEKGLGGCMIGNYNPATVKEKLGLAENLEPVLIVALGKPDEKVVIVDIKEDGKINYYRDENDVHYVPKRKLEDIVL